MIFINFLPFHHNFDIFLSIKSKVFRNTEFKYLKKKHSFFIFKNPINFQGYITKNFKDFNGKYKHLINIGLKGDLQVYSDLQFYSIIENSKFTFSKMLKKNVRLLKNNYNNKILSLNDNGERLPLFFFRVFKLSFYTSTLNELGNYSRIQKTRLNLFNLIFVNSNINIILKKKQILFSLIVLNQLKKNHIFFNESINFVKFYFDCFNFSFINIKYLFYKHNYMHFKNNFTKYLYLKNFKISLNKNVLFLFYNKITYLNFFFFCLFDLYSNVKQYQSNFDLILKNQIINKNLRKKKIFFFKKIFTFRFLKRFKKIILNVNKKDIFKNKINLKSILLTKNRRVARKKIKFLNFFLLRLRLKLKKYTHIKRYFKTFDFKNYRNVKRKFKLKPFFRLTFKKILRKLLKKIKKIKKIKKLKKLKQKFFKHFALVFFYYHHFLLKEFRLKIFPKKFKYFYANDFQKKYKPKFKYKAFDLKTKITVNKYIRKKFKFKKKKVYKIKTLKVLKAVLNHIIQYRKDERKYMKSFKSFIINNLGFCIQDCVFKKKLLLKFLTTKNLTIKRKKKFVYTFLKLLKLKKQKDLFNLLLFLKYNFKNNQIKEKKLSFNYKYQLKFKKQYFLKKFINVSKLKKKVNIKIKQNIHIFFNFFSFKFFKKKRIKKRVFFSNKRLLKYFNNFKKYEKGEIYYMKKRLNFLFKKKDLKYQKKIYHNFYKYNNQNNEIKKLFIRKKDKNSFFRIFKNIRKKKKKNYYFLKKINNNSKNIYILLKKNSKNIIFDKKHLKKLKKKYFVKKNLLNLIFFFSILKKRKKLDFIKKKKSNFFLFFNKKKTENWIFFIKKFNFFFLVLNKKKKRKKNIFIKKKKLLNKSSFSLVYYKLLNRKSKYFKLNILKKNIKKNMNIKKIFFLNKNIFFIKCLKIKPLVKKIKIRKYKKKILMRKIKILRQNDVKKIPFKVFFSKLSRRAKTKYRQRKIFKIRIIIKKKKRFLNLFLNLRRNIFFLKKIKKKYFFISKFKNFLKNYIIFLKKNNIIKKKTYFNKFLFFNCFFLKKQLKNKKIKIKLNLKKKLFFFIQKKKFFRYKRKRLKFKKLFFLNKKKKKVLKYSKKKIKIQIKNISKRINWHKKISRYLKFKKKKKFKLNIFFDKILMIFKLKKIFFKCNIISSYKNIFFNLNIKKKNSITFKNLEKKKKDNIHKFKKNLIYLFTNFYLKKYLKQINIKKIEKPYFFSSYFFKILKKNKVFQKKKKKKKKIYVNFKSKRKKKKYFQNLKKIIKTKNTFCKFNYQDIELLKNFNKKTYKNSKNIFLKKDFKLKSFFFFSFNLSLNTKIIQEFKKKKNLKENLKNRFFLSFLLNFFKSLNFLMYDFFIFKNHTLKISYIDMILQKKKIFNIFREKFTVNVNNEYNNYLNFYIVFFLFLNFLKTNISVKSNFMKFKIYYIQKLKYLTKENFFNFFFSNQFLIGMIKKKKLKKFFFIFINDKISINFFNFFNSFKKSYTLKKVKKLVNKKNFFFIKNIKWNTKNENLHFFFDILKFFIKNS